MSDTQVSPEFTAAADNVKKLKSQPSNEDLLNLYGLYKIARGEDIKTSPTPGVFDLKGKAKKNAWQALIDEDGMTREVAEQRYIEHVNKLVESIGLAA